jgi:hypothetical protein
MSDRKFEINNKAIHPRALTALGLEVCIVMLGVANDLREGKIENFSMSMYFSGCGTPYCIGGHVLARLGYGNSSEILSSRNRELLASWIQKDSAVYRLFNGDNPNDLQLAACAIEHYVIEGADYPWR